MEAISALKQDPQYIEQRMREMRRVTDFFATQLSYFIERMPLEGILIDQITGEAKVIYNKEWEQRFEQLRTQQQESLKTMFPEFY